jgi:hypothetical protein
MTVPEETRQSVYEWLLSATNKTIADANFEHKHRLLGDKTPDEYVEWAKENHTDLNKHYHWNEVMGLFKRIYA